MQSQQPAARFTLTMVLQFPDWIPTAPDFGKFWKDMMSCQKETPNWPTSASFSHTTLKVGNSEIHTYTIKMDATQTGASLLVSQVDSRARFTNKKWKRDVSLPTLTYTYIGHIFRLKNARLADATNFANSVSTKNGLHAFVYTSTVEYIDVYVKLSEGSKKAERGPGSSGSDTLQEDFPRWLITPRDRWFTDVHVVTAQAVPSAMTAPGGGTLSRVQTPPQRTHTPPGLAAPSPALPPNTTVQSRYRTK